MNEVIITVSGVKDEHAAWTTRMAYAVTQLFRLDGSDVETSVSVHRVPDDGVERVYEFLDLEGGDE